MEEQLPITHDANHFIIKNRPMRHYALLLFSWIIQQKRHATIEASGNAIVKLLDFINLTSLLFPKMIKVVYIQSVGEENGIKVSKMVAEIDFDYTHSSTSSTRIPSQGFSTCMLELLLGKMIQRDDIRSIKLFATVERTDAPSSDFSVPIATLDTQKLSISLNASGTQSIMEKPQKRDWARERSRDALIRCGVLHGDYKQFAAKACAYDDVIFGIDTNILYNCTCTTSLLDSTVGVPSNDFLDTPNWIALLVSRVVMAEIDQASNEAQATYKGRQAMRALQEMMLIKNCKDLAGVSIFIRGPIRLGISNNGHEANTIKDSLIRDDFCEFVKDIGMHKGAFFISHDFAACTMAEAEGLNSFYLPKPELEEHPKLWQDGRGCSIAELIYDMAVSFCPLKVCLEGADGQSHDFILESEWPAKKLDYWEQWLLRFSSDDLDVNAMLDQMDEDLMARDILCAWAELNKRYSFVQ